MERKIGEIFECNGVQLKVEEYSSCEECYYNINEAFCDVQCGHRSEILEIVGYCGHMNRTDEKSVIFEQIFRG